MEPVADINYINHTNHLLLTGNVLAPCLEKASCSVMNQHTEKKKCKDSLLMTPTIKQKDEE